MPSFLLTLAMLAAASPSDPPPLHPALAAYVKARIEEFDSIPAERQRQLAELADYVRQCRAAGEPTRLVFICTHNSRRSHFAQLWAQAAAAHYGIAGVETFSGGTQATAFNPRAVAALRRAGFELAEPAANSQAAPQNPRYLVRYQAAAPPLACFSKVYSEDGNPTSDFCAVMTCTDADQACPLVTGAAHRIRLPYDDPKIADDTPQESLTYDARCRQIAREMLFVFQQVGSVRGNP
jgi:arsenate reductase (thioredoxin)